jgi:hypothetical protein
MSKGQVETKASVSRSSAWSRFFISGQFIYSAAFHSRMSHEIELDLGDGRKELSRDLIHQHRSYVIASVLSSVGYLEAAINELYALADDVPLQADISKEIRVQFGWLQDRTREPIAAMWNIESFRRGAKLLEKFDTALELARVPAFDKGGKVYQNVQLLVILRNELVHYKAEKVALPTSSKTEVPLQILEKKLGNRFGRNPVLRRGVRRPLFFPEECLHHACARWAVLSSLDFADNFFNKMDLLPRRGSRDQLSPDCQVEQQP